MADWDFIGFTYNGKHSIRDLGIYRTSNGDRYDDNITATMTDKTVDVPGGDGQYYFGTTFKNRTFTVNYAFDMLTEAGIRQLKEVFCGDGIHDLVFDERPYMAWSAKVTGTASLKHLCFEENGQRVYRGEGSITFTCYYPYAHTPKKLWTVKSKNTSQEQWRYDVQDFNGNTINSNFINGYNINAYPNKNQWQTNSFLPEQTKTDVKIIYCNNSSTSVSISKLGVLLATYESDSQLGVVDDDSFCKIIEFSESLSLKAGYCLTWFPEYDAIIIHNSDNTHDDSCIRRIKLWQDFTYLKNEKPEFAFSQEDYQHRVVFAISENPNCFYTEQTDETNITKTVCEVLSTDLGNRTNGPGLLQTQLGGELSTSFVFTLTRAMYATSEDQTVHAIRYFSPFSKRQIELNFYEPVIMNAPEGDLMDKLIWDSKTGIVMKVDKSGKRSIIPYPGEGRVLLNPGENIGRECFDILTNKNTQWLSYGVMATTPSFTGTRWSSAVEFQCLYR